MFQLAKQLCSEVFQLYLQQPRFFPLIAAVIRDSQDGAVYVNHRQSPTQVYVEHHFGFAQVFGCSDLAFEQSLVDYLLIRQDFPCEKIRLYAADELHFLKQHHEHILLSERQRWAISPESFRHQSMADVNLSDEFQIQAVDNHNVMLVDKQMGLVDRFWRDADAFVTHADGIILLYQQEIAAICYAAASENQRLEIDVLTLPDYRKLGLGKRVVAQFIKNCFQAECIPLWDCYTNNKGSMQLAQSLGFEKLQQPYSFFTINKGNYSTLDFPVNQISR